MSTTPAPYCLLDYRVKPTKEATLPISSEAVLYGDSLFSTLAVLEGVPVFLDSHVRRLNHSARTLGYRTRLDLNRLRMAIDNLITSDRADTARLRITLFNPPAEDSDAPSHVVFLFAGEGEAIQSAEFFPVNKRNLDPMARHKSGNYQGMRQFIRQLKTGEEALLINERGQLLEGTRSNIFLGLDGSLHTPPRDLGILPGVTRGRLLQDKRLKVKVSRLDVDSLENATEAFVCNSVVGIQALSSIGQFQFAEAPGPLTRRAMAAHETLILSDISEWF